MSPLLLAVLTLSSSSFAQEPPAIADDAVWEFMVELDALAPVSTQAQVKQGAHVTVAGKISGACTGLVRVNAITLQMPVAGHEVPEGQEVANPEPVGPITSVERTGSGVFSIAIPSGAEIMLTALCDQDGDGLVDSSGSDLAAPSQQFGKVDVDLDGVDLVLLAGGVEVNTLTRTDAAADDGTMPAPGGEPSGPEEPGGVPPDELPPPE